MASTPRGAQAEAGLQASLPRDAPLFPSDKEGSLLRRHATRRPPQAQAQGVHGRQGRLFAQTRRREGSEAREPTQRERRDRRDPDEDEDDVACGVSRFDDCDRCCCCC